MIRRTTAIGIVTTSLLVVSLASAALADKWPPPVPRVFASEDGSVGFKLLEPTFGGAAVGVLYQLDERGIEKVFWRKTLVNSPCDVYIAVDPRRVVTIDTWGERGYSHSLVVYDDRGKMLVDYPLEELLTPDEIRLHVPESVSSRHWCVHATFAIVEGNEFQVRLDWPDFNEQTDVGPDVLNAQLSELREKANLISHDRIRDRLIRAIQDAQAIAERRPDYDRVIRINLLSGKLIQQEK